MIVPEKIIFRFNRYVGLYLLYEKDKILIFNVV